MTVSQVAEPLTVAIMGVGLLGGSIAACLKQRGIAQRVIGIGRNAERLKAAVEQGLLDDFLTHPESSARDWNMVVIGTPVDRIATDVRSIAAISRPGTLITDVGSSKACILSELGLLNGSGNGVDSAGNILSAELAPGVEFIGSHPLAGSEKRGFEASRPNLFENRVTVITPTLGNSDAAVARATEFWQSLGSRVVTMTAPAHDTALATTSHVPHVVAAALASMLQPEQRQLAATGFRDTTRIAAGDPDLWVAILQSNAAAVLNSLREFGDVLKAFSACIEQQDDNELRRLLEQAKVNREALM